MRIIFTGLHNKPNMAPLDSGTKTGKIVDRIISKLPAGLDIVKSNIIDRDFIPNNIDEIAIEWKWTHLPVCDDIVILLGSMTQTIYKSCITTESKLIMVAHPASKYSNVDICNYVNNVSEKILNKLK